MLDEIELIRQVLASASRAKLPRAEEAMDTLARVNAAMIELRGLKPQVLKAAQDEKEDGRNG